MTWILGVNAPPAGWHDSAACLIDGNGEIVAFSEEERCNRQPALALPQTTGRGPVLP